MEADIKLTYVETFDYYIRWTTVVQRRVEQQTWKTRRQIVHKLHTRMSAFRLCTSTLSQQPLNGRRQARIRPVSV